MTAGNTSGLNDGASALLLTTGAALQSDNLRLLARLVSYAHAGVDPEFMGLEPIPATPLAPKRAGLNVVDLDVIVSNEAFAAQACAVARELEFGPPRSTLTAPASLSVTLWAARRVRSSSPRPSMSCIAPRDAMPWRRCASAVARALPQSSSASDACRTRHRFQARHGPQ